MRATATVTVTVEREDGSKTTVIETAIRDAEPRDGQALTDYHLSRLAVERAQLHALDRIAVWPEDKDGEH